MMLHQEAACLRPENNITVTDSKSVRKSSCVCISVYKYLASAVLIRILFLLALAHPICAKCWFLCEVGSSDFGKSNRYIMSLLEKRKKPSNAYAMRRELQIPQHTRYWCTLCEKNAKIKLFTPIFSPKATWLIVADLGSVNKLGECHYFWEAYPHCLREEKSTLACCCSCTNMTVILISGDGPLFIDV